MHQNGTELPPLPTERPLAERIREVVGPSYNNGLHRVYVSAAEVAEHYTKVGLIAEDQVSSATGKLAEVLRTFGKVSSPTLLRTHNLPGAHVVIHAVSSDTEVVYVVSMCADYMPPGVEAVFGVDSAANKVLRALVTEAGNVTGVDSLGIVTDAGSFHMNGGFQKQLTSLRVSLNS